MRMGIRDRLLIPMIAGERFHVMSAGGVYTTARRSKQGGTAPEITAPGSPGDLRDVVNVARRTRKI